MNLIRSLWVYRGFIFGSVKREFQSKYRNSMLGVAWMIFSPLAMILVYTIVFSQVMRVKLPGVSDSFAYGIFLCSGILAWNFFADIVSKSQSMFLDNANLLKKINFPRICLPAIVLIGASLNFLISLALFTVFLIVFGYFPGFSYLAIFPLVAILGLFGLGLGITLGVLNVFFRDIGQFFGIFLPFWFWLTPVVYPLDVIPLTIQKAITWNPMTSIVEGFQLVLGQGRWPVWESFGPTLFFAIFFLTFGLSLFRKHSGEMVDEL